MKGFYDGLIGSDELVASSKKKYPIQDWSPESIWPETSENKIPLRGTHTYIAHIRERVT